MDGDRGDTTDGVIVGVDVGGTKVLAGVVGEDGTVVRTSHRTTPGRRVEAFMVEDALVEAVLEVADGQSIIAVGVAAAGFVDAAAERVIFAPHLPWRGEPVRRRLSERWGVPVTLDNDANCAAVAEATFGAARSAASALMITLGTGIGGAILLDGGRLHRGAHGMAGEFGHMQVVPDGLPCECGGRGCWEQYSSGNALVRHVLAQDPDHPSALGASVVVPAGLTGPLVTDAARAGDRAALVAFESVGRWLGVGIANLVAAFDPECVVVGGGVSDAGDLLLGPARLAVRDSLVGAAHRDVPPIHQARLGPQAGLIGAATLARRASA